MKRKEKKGRERKTAIIRLTQMLQKKTNQKMERKVIRTKQTKRRRKEWS